MTIPTETPDAVKALFYETLYDIVTHLDFDRIVCAVRASKFGWAYPMVERGATDTDILRRAQKIVKEVAESALTYALTKNDDQFIGSGGFEAIVRPTGQVLEIKFVLDSWDTYKDDDEEAVEDASVSAEEP